MEGSKGALIVKFLRITSLFKLNRAAVQVYLPASTKPQYKLACAASACSAKTRCCIAPFFFMRAWTYAARACARLELKMIELALASATHHRTFFFMRAWTFVVF